MATMIIGGIHAHLDPGEELPFFFHVKRIPCRVVKPKESITPSDPTAEPIPEDGETESEGLKWAVMNNDNVNELIGILKAFNGDPIIREATNGQYIRFEGRTEVITYYQRDEGIVNINAIDKRVGPIPLRTFTIETFIQYLEYFARTIGPDVKVLMYGLYVFTVYKRPNEPYLRIDTGINAIFTSGSPIGPWDPRTIPGSPLTNR